MDFHPDDIIIISLQDELFTKFYFRGRWNSFVLLETLNRSLDNYTWNLKVLRGGSGWVLFSIDIQQWWNTINIWNMVFCTQNEYKIIRADCRNVFVKSAVGRSAVKIERKSVEKGSSYILICNRVFKNCGPEWPFLPLVIINSVRRTERLYCTAQQRKPYTATGCT